MLYQNRQKHHCEYNPKVMCFSSKQEKTQKFRNKHTSILFHLFARILGSRLQLLSKTVKIRTNQIVQLTLCKNKPLMVGECFKQPPCYNWSPSTICCRYAEIALENMQHILYCRCWNYILRIVWTYRCPLKQRTYS